MKNREYRALLAVALMVSLVAGSVKGTMSYVRAEDNQTAVTAQADVDTANETERDADSQARAKKDETVYVKLDGSGNAKSVTVSDQLKNVGDISEIKDVSELKDIENVKGDEEFTRADGKLVWGGENKDICYQGTTDKALPVGVKISYQLDGKDISAEELEGKSGHLKIHYEYQNTTGDEKTAYTPFLMVTGLVLGSEKFTNVMVENGKLVSDGEKDIAIGMGIPKLKETLDVKDIDIPDSFVVEADVTEYTAVKGITVATNEVFNELSTDEFDDIDDLKNAMNELQDAANQLVDGSGKLRDGLDTLLESSGTLIDGIGALAAGGNDLAAGTGKLLGGAEELAKGSTTLADGTGELAEGAKNLNSGAEQIAAGAQSAKGGSAALVNGAEQLNGGIKTMQSEAESAVQQLSAGAQNLKNGIAAMKNGADSLNAGIDSAATGAAALQAGVQNAKSGVDNISALAQGIELQTTAADSNYEVSVYVNNAQKRNAVAEVLRSAGVDEATIELSLIHI